MDVEKIKTFFDSAFNLDSRANNISKRNEVKFNFLNQLTNINLSEKERIILACRVFDNSPGSYSRERFFELCFENEAIDETILTDLYLSVHT